MRRSDLHPSLFHCLVLFNFYTMQNPMGIWKWIPVLKGNVMNVYFDIYSYYTHHHSQFSHVTILLHWDPSHPHWQSVEPWYCILSHKVHSHLLADISVQGCGHGQSGMRLQRFPKSYIILCFAWIRNKDNELTLHTHKKLSVLRNEHNKAIFIVAPCILITLKFLSPTNAPLYYTYKMLKYTVKISHDCSYMFQSIWTIIREPMPNLAEVTILWRYSVKIRCQMFSNVGKKCYKLRCVLCAVQFVTAHNTHRSLKHFLPTLLNI